MLDHEIQCTVFVGGPFSAALQFNSVGEITGFDPVLRDKFEAVYSRLRALGAYIVSSHLAEDFGQDVHEHTLVQRDNAWLRGSDLYLAILPFNKELGEPYRTDGTFVEIGMALGLKKTCVLLLEHASDPAWSYYVRNLAAEPGIICLPLDTDIETFNRTISDVAHIDGTSRAKPAIRDASVLTSLIYGGKDGHQTVHAGRSFFVPPGLPSSWFDESIRLSDDLIQTLDFGGAKSLIIAEDAGEVAQSYFSNHREQRLTIAAPTRRAFQAIRNNLEGSGLDIISHLDTAKIPLPDNILVYLPPLEFSSGTHHPFKHCLDETHAILKNVLLSKTLVHGGIITSSTVRAVQDWLGELNDSVRIERRHRDAFALII